MSETSSKPIAIPRSTENRWRTISPEQVKDCFILSRWTPFSVYLIPVCSSPQTQKPRRKPALQDMQQQDAVARGPTSRYGTQQLSCSTAL